MFAVLWHVYALASRKYEAILCCKGPGPLWALGCPKHRRLTASGGFCGEPQFTACVCLSSALLRVVTATARAPTGRAAGSRLSLFLTGDYMGTGHSLESGTGVKLVGVGSGHSNKAAGPQSQGHTPPSSLHISSPRPL